MVAIPDCTARCTSSAVMRLTVDAYSGSLLPDPCQYRVPWMDFDAPLTFSLATTYVHLTEAGAVQLADGGAAFWRRSPSEIDQDFSGWLVTAYSFDVGSGGWERHPAGDQVLH